MKKIYKLEELDCAHCAAKMEDAIKKIEGVNAASVNFIALKLTVDIDDDIFEETMQKIIKACKKIEPDCKIIL